MRFCRWIAQRASAQEGRGHAAEDDGRHAQPADGRHLVAEQQHAEQRREDDAGVLEIGHHHGRAARVGARHAQLAQRSQDAHRQQPQRLHGVERVHVEEQHADTARQRRAQ